MAQRTTVTLIDDLDGSPADRTVEFGVDGVAYEIDLTAAHADTLREVFGPYIASARRLPRRQAASPGGSTRSPVAAGPSSEGRKTATVDREQNKAVRDWAARHGHTLSRRGRIPGAVVEAFHRGDSGALRPQAAADTRSDTPSAASTTAELVGPDGVTVAERETIRAWALEEGIEVKSRGRLGKDLIANYRATQARR